MEDYLRRMEDLQKKMDGDTVVIDIGSPEYQALVYRTWSEKVLEIISEGLSSLEEIDEQ